MTGEHAPVVSSACVWQTGEQSVGLGEIIDCRYVPRELLNQRDVNQLDPQYKSQLSPATHTHTETLRAERGMRAGRA